MKISDRPVTPLKFVLSRGVASRIVVNMERVRFVSENGHRILLHDFSGCDVHQLTASLQAASGLACSDNGVPHLVLVDVTDLKFDNSMIAVAKDYADGVKDCITAVAIIGLTGIQETMLGFITAAKEEIAIFRDPAAAKAWLLSRTI
ncbi:MAG TPA: hypothetical protein VI756_10825 [Blastocatellia bacterium]